MANLIYASIAGSVALANDVWSLPCTSTFQITLNFGGTPFTMSERDSVVRLSNGTCRGAVTGGAQGIAKVGSPFMRNVYTYVQFFLGVYVNFYGILLFYRRFGAERASNGTLSFFVGFARKIRRSRIVTTTVLSPTTVTASPTARARSTGSRISIHDVILFSTLAVVSIVALIL
jgi:hypothetical protein